MLKWNTYPIVICCWPNQSTSASCFIMPTWLMSKASLLQWLPLISSANMTLTPCLTCIFIVQWWALFDMQIWRGLKLLILLTKFANSWKTSLSLIGRRLSEFWGTLRVLSTMVSYYNQPHLLPDSPLMLLIKRIGQVILMIASPHLANAFTLDQILFLSAHANSNSLLDPTRSQI